MERQTAVIAVLVLFVLIGAMQSVQLANLQDRLSGYSIQAQPQNEQPQSAQQLPSNLQQLPQQIGGC